MVGSTGDRRRAVDALLREYDLRAAARDGAALVVIAEGAVLWATPAAADLLGLEAASSAATALPLARLTTLATELPLGGPLRLERVRMLSGRQAIAQTLACRAVTLDESRRALAVMILGVKGAPVDLAEQLWPGVEPPEPPAPVQYSLEDLRARAGGRSALRFVWQCEHGRFIAAAPELHDLLGADIPRMAGRTWPDLNHAGIIDLGGALALALNRAETFHALATLWPVIAGRSYILVHLSGVPALDRDHRIIGFRGFGLCRLDRLEPPPAPEKFEGRGNLEEGKTEPEDVADDGPRFPLSPVASVEDEMAWLRDQTQEPPATPVMTLAPEPEASGPISPQEPAPTRPSAVVPFSRVRGAASGNLASPKVVQLRNPIVSSPPSATGLSHSERHAFREIARALGARIEGEDRPAAQSPVSSKISNEASVPGLADRKTGDSDEIAAPEPPSPDVASSNRPAIEPAAPASSGGELGESHQHPIEPVGRDAPSLEAAPGPQGAIAALFDRLPLGLLISRGETALAANKSLLDLLGYGDLNEFEVHGGVAALFRGRSEQALAAAAERGQIAIAGKDGLILAVDVTVQKLDWQGAPAALLSFCRAAENEASPKLKALELDLRRREAEGRELRAILDTATDGVIVLDESGRILSLNRSAEALFGYDQNEVCGETYISLLTPESHAAAMDYLEGLKANGVASVMNDGREVVGRVRQGGRIPLFMTLGRVSDHPDPKFCAVLRDITPWKRAENDLLEAKRAAEASSAQKSDFLAKISHEIRTPLSAIIGFAEVMMEERFGPIGNERYKEYLRDIHASGGHVISLVNDLLDLSKIEAGRFELNFTSVDVNEIVGGCVSLMQPQAAEARVVVRSSLAPQLPRIVADERSIRQIVLNILSNAIRFTDPGGQVIVSTAFTDRGEVVMRVRDTGIGMTEAEIETALEPFRQIFTPGRPGGGTGLGLPLTKALVEANRASLIIRSAKQAGTLVEIVFPTTRVLAE